NAFIAYLQGVHRVAEFRRLEAIFSLLSIVSSLLLLVFDGKILSLVIVSQFWAVLSVLRNRSLCLKFDQNIFINRKKFKFYKEIFDKIWPSSWRSGLGVLMSYGIVQSSTLVFAQSDDVGMVSSYLFSMRIMQIILNFCQAPFYSKIPQMSTFYAKGEYEKIKEVAKRGMGLSFLSYFLCWVIIYFFANPILALLGSNITFIPSLLWTLMGFSYFIERYGAMHIQLYTLTDDVIWHISNGISGTIYVLLIFLFYSKLGVYVFPLSMIISYCLFYSWFNAYKSYSVFKMNFLKFEITSSLPFLLLFIVFIAIDFYKLYIK
ncbi:MAG: hypothetical protein ACK4IX_04060, partial [Candidatus Sericytochromatia bacterium]